MLRRLVKASSLVFLLLASAYASVLSVQAQPVVVQFIASVMDAPQPTDISAIVEQVVGDPTGRLRPRVRVWIDAYGYYQPNSRVDWPLAYGDRIEVYGEGTESEGVWWVGVHGLPHYLKKIAPSLGVDVWTNEGGRGANVRDGSYQFGDMVTIYYWVSTDCDAEVTVTKPDGWRVPLVSSGPNKGGIQYSANLNADQEGEWEVLLRAWQPGAIAWSAQGTDEEASDRTWFTVGSQPFDFSISVEPSRRTIKQGESTTFSVTVTSLTSSIKTVSLSLSGRDETMSYSFNPSSGYPTFISTLTITSASSTPIRTCELRVAGRDGGKEASASIELIIEKRPAPKLEIFGPKKEFKGESCFVWAIVYGYEGYLEVRATADNPGWIVSPSAVKVLLSAPNQVVVIAYQVTFTNDKDGIIAVYVPGSDLSRTIEIDLQGDLEKTVITTIFRFTVTLRGDLKTLYDLASADSVKVKEFTKEVLRLAGASLQSPDYEIADILFRYVIKHVEFKEVGGPKSIASIVDEINEHGGCASEYRIAGDCDQSTIFLGGLLRAANVPIRTMGAPLEDSSLTAVAYHAWLEARIRGEWVVFDAGKGWYEYMYVKDESFPMNIREFALAQDHRKSYEFAQEGGPLIVCCHDPEANEISDRTSEYKLNVTWVPDPTVIYAQSSVSLRVYDEKAKLLGEGVPFLVVRTIGTANLPTRLTYPDTRDHSDASL